MKDSEYKFFFESVGYNLLLEDLIIESYTKWPILVVYKDKVVKKYLPKHTFIDLENIGLKWSRQEIEYKHQELNYILKEAEGLRLKSKWVEQDAVSGLELIKNVLHNYSYFDGVYTEGIYKQNPTDDRVKLIQSIKNILRQDIEDVLFTKNSLFNRLINAISNLINQDFNEVISHREHELIEVMRGDKSLHLNEIQSRQKSFIYIKDHNHNVTFLSDQNALSYPIQLDLETENVDKAMKGITAWGSGKLSGSVTIINRDYEDHQKFMSDMQEMSKGNILVATVTDPEYLPAMKKASAIITQQGGMLSHAAIVARELDIPCVVGVSNVSQILKNDDNIEINFDAGEIKIV